MAKGGVFMSRVDLLKLVVSILACQLAGFLGSIFTTPAIPDWYAKLAKPSFTPPNWIFSPVWISLYVLMGISAFLIWRKGLDNKAIKVALGIFLAQLVINSIWSLMFFGLRSPLAGFITIIILWILIVLTISHFYRISTVAGVLLVPYFLWVSFASVLNFSLWRLNP
jgi:benzodiazapine receptor